MTDHRADDSDPGKPPGFVACGAMMLLVLIVYGAVAAGIASAMDSGLSNPVNGVLGLAILGSAVYFGNRNPRFVPCMVKGLLALAVFGIIVFGACLALIVGGGI